MRRPRHRAPALLAAVLLGLLTATPVARPVAARPQLPDPAPALRSPGPDALTFRPHPRPWPDPPAVSAAAHVLLHAETGQVLAEHEADVRRPVASTVKILTAITALRRTDVDEAVVVGQEVVGIEGASVGLRPGDRRTVGELLDAMLVRSGNDAALALAAHVGGGSVERFVRLMRADAHALGLDGVVLHSPHGLDDRNRMSAADLAVITRVALRDQRFRASAALRSVVLPRIGELPSRNLLVGRYPGATGVKTGHTDAAGWSLVASARRDGRELVAVVLASASDEARFGDAARLLDHGFGAFAEVRAQPRLRLRRAGEWVDLTGPAVPLLVPRSGPEAELVARLPVDVPEGVIEAELVLRWSDSELATLGLRGAARRQSVSATPAVGRWLADRLHAGMRAAAMGRAPPLWSRSGAG